MSRNTLNFQTETLDPEVQKAAHAFAQALAESAEFQAYEQTAERLGQDETAKQAIWAFQEKQRSLQMLIRLNAVSPEDRAEVDRLQKAFTEHSTVKDYMKAQEELTILCQAAADLLSERIGVSFTAACGPGCC